MLLVLLVTAGLSACTSMVGGSAVPVAEQEPPSNEAPPGEPCALLSPEEATGLGLVAEGEFTAGDPAQLMPPNCDWARADPNDDRSTPSVGYEIEFTMAEYFNGDEPVETLEFGGLDWGRYEDALGGDSVCFLATELDNGSFVVLVTSDFGDESKACDVAKEVAPYVASHLPGGEQAPPPPTTEEPEPSSLATADACTFLAPKEAEQLGFSGAPEPLEGLPESDIPPGCQWDDTDGEGGIKALDLNAGDLPESEWPYADEATEQVKAGDFTWNITPHTGGIEPNCQATMTFTETSSVKLASGNLDDPKKACDKVKEAIPLVTANLPQP
ncbi:hypothetical protein BAY61_00780 [Prauserella marina]|nr:hypothetical protein BAY61_00780 [Prauserella marina]